MSTAQHATRILSAWKTADALALDTALSNAQQSFIRIRSMSRLENEKQELLECVVEHLRSLDSERAAFESFRAAATATLLAHLSSDFSDQTFRRLNTASLTTKN